MTRLRRLVGGWVITLGILIEGEPPIPEPPDQLTLF